MRMTKKGEAPKPDDVQAIAEVPAYPWDHAMKMLGSGDYDLVGDPRNERGPDQPGAQSPAPGVDPVGGKEKAADGQTLTNMDATAAPSTVSGGLPKSPAPAQNPALTAAGAKVAQPAAGKPAG